MKKIIATAKAPSAIGPYSQATALNNLLFTSGQIPLDPASGEIVGTDITTQTRQAIRNLSAVLEAGGANLAQVLKTTVFLSDMNNFAAMNAVYAEFFGTENYPARSAVQVARLPKDVLVEIEAIAQIK